MPHRHQNNRLKERTKFDRIKIFSSVNLFYIFNIIQKVIFMKK